MGKPERWRKSVICSALDVSVGVALFAAEVVLVMFVCCVRTRCSEHGWIVPPLPEEQKPCLHVSLKAHNTVCSQLLVGRIFCNGNREKRRRGRERKMLVISNEHKFHFAYFVAENDKQSAYEKVNYCSLCRSFINEPFIHVSAHLLV